MFILNAIFNGPRKLFSLVLNILYRQYFRFQGVYIGNNSRISLKSKIKIIYGGNINIGERCDISEYSMILSYGGCIIMGNDCSVNPFVILYGHGDLTIGNGVRIASHSVFIPSNHNFEDVNEYIFEQGETSRGIIVEDDVWIGTRVTILDGVTIRQGCVIAAGAVVTKSTEAYCVYAGIPAKKIRSRLQSNVLTEA